MGGGSFSPLKPFQCFPPSVESFVPLLEHLGRLYGCVWRQTPFLPPWLLPNYPYDSLIDQRNLHLKRGILVFLNQFYVSSCSCR